MSEAPAVIQRLFTTAARDKNAAARAQIFGREIFQGLEKVGGDFSQLLEIIRRELYAMKFFPGHHGS